MRKLWIVLVLIILPSGCTRDISDANQDLNKNNIKNTSVIPTEVDNQSYIDITIICEISYRPNTSSSIEKIDTIYVNSKENDQIVRYKDMSFHILYDDGKESYETRFIKMQVLKDEDVSSLYDVLYQISESDIPINQMNGGEHGFTGLIYAHHPVSQAEIQFICFAK